MFSKVFQLTKPGPRKTQTKKNKAASGGPPSGRSASTGSIRYYPSPQVMVGRQRSQTADQPRSLRRGGGGGGGELVDARVRQTGPASRQSGRRTAPPPRSRSPDQLGFGERLPSLRARIAEMRALASLLPDSEISASDGTGSETRTNLMSLLRSHSRDSDVPLNAGRARRKPGAKSSGATVRSRRGGHGEGAVRSRRAAPRDRDRDGDRRSPRRAPRALRGGGRERTPRQPAYRSDAEPAHRSPRGTSSQGSEDCARDSASSGHAPPSRRHDVGRTYTELEPHEDTEPQPEPEPPAEEPEPRAAEPPAAPVDPQQLLAAMPPVPDLGALLAPTGGGQQNLQQVIQNFLMAKQQASAAASMMNSLRGAIESVTGQPESGDDAHPSLPALAAAPAAAQQPPAAAAQQLATAASAVAAAASPRSSMLSQPRSGVSQSQQRARRPAAAAAPQAGAAAHGAAAATAGSAGSAGRLPARAMPAIVSDTGSSWRTVSGSCVQTAADLRSPAAVGGEAAAPAPGTGRSASSGSSAGTVYMLPGDSRSQLDKSTASKPPPEQVQLASEPEDAALRSVSEAGLAPEPPEPAEPDDDVTQLKERFQLQQTKLRMMEQKNYVLSLAVEGQEKTIRTMSDELQTARAAASQGTQQQRQQQPQQWVRGQAAAVLHEQRTTTVGPAPTAAAAPSDANLLSAQSWPIASTKTEFLPEDPEENRQEAGHIASELERKEQELSLLKAKQAELDLKQRAFATPSKAFSPLPTSKQTDQTGWRWRAEAPGTPAPARSVLGGGRTRSTEQYRTVAPVDVVRTQSTPLRRHSFAVAPPPPPPPQSLDDDWRHHQLPLLGRPASVPTPTVPPTNTVYEARCQELRETVDESLARVRELENQLFELKCNRDRGDTMEPAGLAALAGAAEPASAIGAGTMAPGAMCKPFPQILRMTELKLQQVYQSLLQEQHKNKVLNKNVHELNVRLEQHSSQSEKLKERLTGSVEERRALQARLQQAETTSADADRRADELRQELHRKQELLNQTSQHLEERSEQASALSRELDAVRSEAAHEAHVSAERVSELRAHAAQLETRLSRQQAEARLLRQASQEAGALTRSQRRLRQRLLELQERLDQSQATCKQLEGYVVFLKTSYSRMFGSAVSPAAGGGAVPAAAFELPASVRDLLETTATDR